MRCPTMNVALWTKLERFQLDDPATSLPFSRRLARDNGWSANFARRVAEEYKRFLYLCCAAGHPVTPSDEVDQAWHLHLCYTRSYWEDLCRDTLGQPVHHGPTVGGPAEGAKFDDWYARTLAAYRAHFAAEPPSDIWPARAVRFGGQRFERVDRASHFVVPRRALYTLMGAGGAGVTLVGCATALTMPAHEHFLGLILAIAVFSVVAGLLRAAFRRGRAGRQAGGENSSTLHLGLGGGCGSMAVRSDKHSGDSDSGGGGDSSADGGSGCGGSGCGGGGCGGGG